MVAMDEGDGDGGRNEAVMAVEMEEATAVATVVAMEEATAVWAAVMVEERRWCVVVEATVVTTGNGGGEGDGGHPWTGAARGACRPRRPCRAAHTWPRAHHISHKCRKLRRVLFLWCSSYSVYL